MGTGKRRINKKKIIIAFGVVLSVLLVLYFVLVNTLVSAALVPSFMEKLEAFERITEESYAAQVQTSDIKVNRQLTLNATEEWLQTVEHRKLSAQNNCPSHSPKSSAFPDGTP